MTGKWTIKRLNRHDGRPLPMPWHAIPPHTPIPPRDLSHHSMRVLYEDDDVGTGATHAEALAYADRQARTVEVELPPVKPGQQKFLQNSYVRGAKFDQVVRLVDMADHECIYIDKFDWKELGEYLLALHYHHERNQK